MKRWQKGDIVELNDKLKEKLKIFIAERDAEHDKFEKRYREVRNLLEDAIKANIKRQEELWAMIYKDHPELELYKCKLNPYSLCISVRGEDLDDEDEKTKPSVDDFIEKMTKGDVGEGSIH